MKDDLKVNRIEQGTVIDHLPAGSVLNIIGMLNLGCSEQTIIAMNVSSSNHRRKDMVKFENKFLSKDETDKISLVAPKATINIIKNGRVTDKRKTKAPDKLVGLLVCPNKNCITNFEICDTKFIRDDRKYRCYFCERVFKIKDFRLA